MFQILKEFKLDVTLQKSYKLRYAFRLTVCFETHCQEDKFWNLRHMPTAPVEGPMVSLHIDTIGLSSILQNVEEHYNRYVQLMIFIDCLALLMILSKWGQSDFWPDPGDMVHFDVVFPLINKL